MENVKIEVTIKELDSLINCVANRLVDNINNDEIVDECHELGLKLTGFKPNL